jgi:Mannosyl-glycoprotein endo-beta-N-acetylglucosaminidase
MRTSVSEFRRAPTLLLGCTTVQPAMVSALFFIPRYEDRGKSNAGMLKENIEVRTGSKLFWSLILLATTLGFLLASIRFAENPPTEGGGNIPDSSAAKILDELMSSWTPDRAVMNEAGVIAEPFSARFGTFPDTVIHLALMVQDSFGVPAAVTLAQWALESGFGKNSLADHNYFGHTYAAVKQYMPLPAYVTAYDRVLRGGAWKRVAVRFAKYENIEECFMVHGEYISHSEYYKSAFRAKTVKGFIARLAEHYAEDPEYAVKLIAIIDRYNLEEKVNDHF